MVGAFSTPHLMSIKSYLGFLDFNYVHDRAQRRIENVAARISSRMSWHGLSGAKTRHALAKAARLLGFAAFNPGYGVLLLEKRTPGAAEVGSCLTDATRGAAPGVPFVRSHCAEARTHAPAVNVA